MAVRASNPRFPDSLPVEARRFVESLVKDCLPEKIILFGSHATGKASPDSDVDLMVIMPFEGRGPELAGRLRAAHLAHFPLDLLIKTPEGIRDRLALGDPFIRNVIENGRVVYEASDPRMG